MKIKGNKLLRLGSMHAETMSMYLQILTLEKVKCMPLSELANEM